jgi:outer membrane beta-barrel protein
MRTKTFLIVCLGLVAFATDAAAQRYRVSALEGQPAVRHRYELRDGRFRLGPSFNISLDRSLRYSLMGGIQMDYHFHDYFSAGASIALGGGAPTGLHGELESSYTTPEEITVWDDQKTYMNDVFFAADVRATFNPIYGRIAIFSKAFVTYDLYAFLGVAFALTQNKYELGRVESGGQVFDPDAANQGFRVGPALGLGLNVFVLNWFAIGFEVKDYMFMDNQTGQDQTRGLGDGEVKKTGADRFKVDVDSEDQSFMQHWYFGLNFMFYFPIEPRVSR